MRIFMMRVWVGVAVLVGSGVVAAQQPPVLTQPVPGAPASDTVTTRPVPPTDRPARLMVAQQLALAAYPELRTRGLQLRVDTQDRVSSVTLGFADRDAADVLAVSRPRAAQLVVAATFDAEQQLVSAVLRGPLAYTAERRRVRAQEARIAQALEEDGAAFGPDRRAALLQGLDLAAFDKVLGRLTVGSAAFQHGSLEDGLYWEVAATTLAGEAVTLGFEPYAGRLVRYAKGGGQ